MKIVKAPKFKCSKCNKQSQTDIQEFEEPEINTEPRNMGIEIQYLWTLNTECEHCQNGIEITIEGYEYPEGFLNHSQTNSNGCLVISETILESEIS